MTFLLWMLFQKSVIMGQSLKLWTHYQYQQLMQHFLKFTPKFLVRLLCLWNQTVIKNTLNYHWTSFFTHRFWAKSSISIKQGQLVHVFKKWGPEYKIEFDITVKKVPSNWTNIVQFTIGGKQGQYGDRIPGVYLVPSNRRVLVCSGVNGLINHQFSFEYSLNQLVHIVV